MNFTEIAENRQSCRNYDPTRPVEEKKLECHKNELLVSFEKGIEPKSIEGGEISLHEEHKEFNTYKITHTGTVVIVKI